MANYKVVNADQLDADLEKVADAIRSKTGKADAISFPDGYESEIQSVYDAGKKAEYDAFWDAFQDGGAVIDLQYYFAGQGWDEASFKPKYDIVAQGACDRIFYRASIIDLKQALLNSGATMDLSKATSLNLAFAAMYKLTTLPKIDASGATNIQQIFASSSKLVSIDEFVVGANTAFSNSFNNCYALEHMILTGTIAKSGFNVQHSTQLDKESLTSIVNALSTTTSGLSITLSKTAVNTAFETSTGAANGSTSTEWTTLAGTKTNWTINLV